MSGKLKLHVVRAWAVVCKSGEIHGGTTSYLDLCRKDSMEAVRWLDRVEPVAPCGPHKLVPLTGEAP